VDQHAAEYPHELVPSVQVGEGPEGRLVGLRLRGRASTLFLPAQLLPGHAIDELRARIAGKRSAAATSVPAGGHSYSVDASFRRPYGRAVFRLMVTRPASVVLMVAVAVVGLAVNAYSVVWLLVTALLMALPFGVVLTLMGLRIARRSRFLHRGGFTYAAAVEDDGLWLHTPLRTGTIAYGALKSVTERGGFVRIGLLGSTSFYVLPVQIFPGGAVEDLRARIAAAKPVR
jgi:hypothetical protein